MDKENKLINKVKRLIRRIGLPRWLHHYGPKKYEFLNHAVAYIIKQECKLGYRRVTRLLRWLGFKCPCPSALCTSFNKLPLQVWQKLLNATTKQKLNLIAIDASGMSRPLPSPYYYKRIDKPYPVEIPLKVSITVDTKTKKILSLRLRSKKAHDLRDVKYLIKRLPSKPNFLIADRAYDAEWVHSFCNERGIKTCIPLKRKGKAIHKMWSLRRINEKNVVKRRYGRREMAETAFSSIKRMFGPSVSSVKFSAQRAEMYCRAIAYNIFLFSCDFLNGAWRFFIIN